MVFVTRCGNKDTYGKQDLRFAFTDLQKVMLGRRLCLSLTRSNLYNPIFCRKFSDPFGHSNKLAGFSGSKLNKSVNRSVLPNPLMGDALRPSAALMPSLETADKWELLRALETSLNTSFSPEPLLPPPTPLIIVISGPSGVGKDAVIKKLREAREGIHFVVTATSRQMRPGEVDGKDYFFVSKEEFLSMIDRDELLEYALVYGDYKGIPKQQIRDYMAEGYDIILRVDIQGAATLRKILGDSALFIFLVAESELALVNRLIDRKTETNETLLVRIATAREEVRHINNFDFVVVNAQGKLDNAVKTVESIIDAEKAKVKQRNAAI